MTNKKRHKIALKTAVRVIGLATLESVLSRSRDRDTAATRALFIAMCRHFRPDGAPATLVDIAETFGWRATSQGHVAGLVDGVPGEATAELASLWAAALDGERVKPNVKLSRRAACEVSTKYAEVLNG